MYSFSIIRPFLIEQWTRTGKAMASHNALVLVLPFVEFNIDNDIEFIMYDYPEKFDRFSRSTETLSIDIENN